MALDKTCIMFDGGKRIELSTDMNPGNEGIMLTRDASGNWDIVIKARISALEAKDTIFKYNDLTPTQPGQTVEESFPNMPYFSAMDDHGNPIEIKLAARTELIPVYDRNDVGFLMLKMQIAGFGKTQNGKTQNSQG